MVEEMTRYTAELTRSGKWWSAWVPEIEHATQGRTLREVDEMVRDLIEIWLEENGVKPADPNEIKVKIDIVLPQRVQFHIDQAELLRRHARRTQAEAADELAAAAQELRETGMSLRDVGQALGVSYQRAHQLVHAKPKANREPTDKRDKLDTVAS